MSNFSLVFQWIGSLCYFGVLILSSIIGGTLVIPSRLFKRAPQRICYWAAKVNLLSLKYLCGLDYTIRGQRPTIGPVIFALKHQSTWDTIGLLDVFMKEHPALVVKKEIDYIPFYGWLVNAWGSIPVNRKDGRNALKFMVDRARKFLEEENRSILIFPEGHRSNPGDAPDYHPGVAALYRDLNLPVVPLALNSGCFWKRRGLMKYPGTIVVEFMEPIQPGLDRKEFMKILEERIETKTNELITGADIQSEQRIKNTIY